MHEDSFIKASRHGDTCTIGAGIAGQCVVVHIHDGVCERTERRIGVDKNCLADAIFPGESCTPDPALLKLVPPFTELPPRWAQPEPPPCDSQSPTSGSGGGMVHDFGGNPGVIEQHPLDCEGHLALAADDGVVVVCDELGIVAYDATEGAELWTVDANWGVGTPSLAGGMLAVRTESSIMGLDALTGEGRWFHDTFGDGPVLIRNGWVLFIHGNREVRSLHLGTGDTRLCTEIGSRVEHLAASNAVIVAGGAKVTGFDARTGELLWSAKVTCEFGVQKLCLHDDVLVVGTFEETLVLNALTGRVLWRVVGEQPREWAIGSGLVLIEHFSYQVAAYDVRTGVRKWTHPGMRSFGVEMYVLSDCILLYGRNGLCGLSNDGEMLWLCTAAEMGVVPARTLINRSHPIAVSLGNLVFPFASRDGEMFLCVFGQSGEPMVLDDDDTVLRNLKEWRKSMEMAELQRPEDATLASVGD